MSGIISSISQYLQLYHLVHYAVILFYPLVRFTPQLRPHFFPSKQDFELAAMESNVLMLLGAYIAIKGRRMESMDAYFSHVFFVTEAALCVIFFREDVVLGIFYLLVALIVSFTFNAPDVDKKHRVVAVTLQRMENLLANKGKNGKIVYTIVEMYAPWSPPCNLVARAYACLSKKYSSDYLKFLKVNVSAQNDVAEKYNIDVGVRSRKLPTFILFADGEELFRMPHVYKNGSVENCKFSEEILEDEFGLAVRTLGQKMPTIETDETKEPNKKKKSDKQNISTSSKKNE
eukprot:m.60418 g.60418  ORF g.60418 m.60418 type:complete len:288 (+) comp7941_c0_seq2:70-933(+)